MRRLRVWIAEAVLIGVVVAGQAPTAHADPAAMPTGERASVVKLAAGRSTACLVAGSRVYCWGNGNDGRIGTPSSPAVTSPRLVVGAPTDLEAVTVGKDHGCVLRTGGAVFCFGRNLSKQLGSTDTSATTNEISSPNDFTQIAAGDDFTCGISTSGGVMCWGLNSGGMLGGVLGADKAVTANSATPLAINMGDDTAVALAAGSSHVCALLASTKVKCWGDNAVGQLGDGYGNNVNDSASTPGIMGRVPHYVLTSGGDQGVTANHLSGVVALSAGISHTCAVLSSGEGHCWGAGATGQLAHGSVTGVRTNPVAVRTEAATPEVLTDLKGVFAGEGNTCFVRTSGVVACAGNNTYGQLGNATGSASYAYGPVNVVSTQPGMNNVVSVAGGVEFNCALTSTGRAYCWGRGTSGQIGNGATDSKDVPTAISGAASQTISAVVPTTKSINDSSFTVSGTATGGGEVVFSSLTTSVCTVSGTTVTLVNVGTCSVRASAGPVGIYVAAADVDSSLTITAAAPTASTGAVSDLTTTTATLAAVVSAKGMATSTSFEYGTSETLASGATTVAATAVSGVTGVNVTVALSALAPGATYFYRIVATSDLGTSRGEIVSFSTKGAKPTVTTGTASTEASAASLSAEVNANEVDALVSFEYGTDASLATAQTIAVTDVVTGATAKAVSVSVTPLSPGTTYHYRVVATNAVGTSKGEIKSFTTKGAKPVVSTGTASRSASGWTLNGKMNAKDLETTFRFEYGTDAKLAGAQQTAVKTQAGSDDVDVSVAISSLAENTTYYYRIVATNAVGVANGEIRSFTTTRPEGVSINDGEEFTSSENVVVSVVGPATAVKAILSNDGGFKISETFDLVNNSAEIKWKLQSSREGTFTKIVYVKYVSRFGSQSQAESDDIILDTSKPVMAAATATAAAPTGSAVQVARVGLTAKKAAGGVRLSLRGSDTISGIGTIEVRSAANKPAATMTVSRVAGKADGKPRAASQTVTLKTTAKRLQVRVIDRAGNASAWRIVLVR